MTEDINSNDPILEVINQFSSNQPPERDLYEQYQELIDKHTEHDE